MGEVRVPAGALYGAQTQRAAENFPISGRRFTRRFIEALGRLKEAAAETNAELGLVATELSRRDRRRRRARSPGARGTTTSPSTSTRPGPAPRPT